MIQYACFKRKNPGKCFKYYTTLYKKGKDVEKIFESQKLESKQKKNKKQKGEPSKRLDLPKKKAERNVELSKRLNLLEKKTESELRLIVIHTHACTLKCPCKRWITKAS